MILIVGGICQGQEELAESLAAGDAEMVFSKVHLWIREGLKQGKTKEELEQELREKWEKQPELILTADEIGCGIVPMEPFERQYRETAGRLLSMTAKEADTVYRVIAGIPSIIKGTE